MRVMGRVSFEGAGQPAPTDLSRATIRVVPAQSSGVAGSGPTGLPGADAPFVVTGLLPGRYRLTASAGTWSLKSAMLDGRDLADVAFETLTDSASQVSGTLFDSANRPTSGLSMIVFTTDKAQWFQGSRRLRQPVRAASDGKFSFTGLPAGEYYLAALPDFEPNDWFNP